MKEYYVYIMTSKTGTLYTGFSGNLELRDSQHKAGEGSKFTQKYRVRRLVYYEVAGDVFSAIQQEKQIKKWRREKKIKLIESLNPKWKDLSEESLD
jgi:putative endonuclease